MVNIKVYLEREGRNIKLNVKNMNELFKKLKINPETVIIAKNNELVTKDIKIKENDEIKLLSVISGG